MCIWEEKVGLSLMKNGEFAKMSKKSAVAEFCTLQVDRLFKKILQNEGIRSRMKWTKC